MKFLIKILYWICVMIVIGLFLSASNPITSQDISIMKDPLPQESNIETDFIIKTLITVLILIVGYLISLGINTVIKRLESNSNIEKELSGTLNSVQNAVNGLTKEMKFQRQKNNQYEIEIAILKKRQNRTDNKLNHQQIEIEKLKIK